MTRKSPEAQLFLKNSQAMVLPRGRHGSVYDMRTDLTAVIGPQGMSVCDIQIPRCSWFSLADSMMTHGPLGIHFPATLPLEKCL